uniref:protein-serine/threonine phosphatase n=1 Tax=Strongyloides venezuelensis TaxID=75913 RepID=A0A0K0FXZ0_STRVS
MSPIVSLIDSMSKRRKVLGETNSKNFNKHKIEREILDENVRNVNCHVTKSTVRSEYNEGKNSFGIIDQKSSNMVVLVPGESNRKVPTSSIKTQILEPIFVSCNIDELKLRRNIHTQIHLSYLKSLYKKDKQRTISRWNVGSKERIEYDCRVNSGRFMLEPSRNICQNNSMIVDAMFNLYNNVTQEIFDTVNCANMDSSSSLMSEISKIKSRLKSVETTVVNENGIASVEKKDKEGYFIQVKSDNVKKREGFVVDLKPDFEIAQVTENIFLGSQDVAMDEVLLKTNNITHIINVSIDVPNYFPDKFVYLSLKIYDRPDTNLNNYIPTINNFINEALANFQNPKIFIHCNAGISRSVSVTIAYLILCCGLSYDEAYKKIKNVRKNARPNDGFMKQLKNM